MNCKGKEGKANGIVWYDMTWNGMKWNGMTYEYEYEYNTVLVPDTVINGIDCELNQSVMTLPK